MATYKTRNLPGFEHLLVVGEEHDYSDDASRLAVVEVSTFINTGVVVGDRELRINLPPRALWISPDNLESVPDVDAEREFASDNPFGEFQFEGRFEKGDLTVVHVVFKNATTITIYEKSHMGSSDGQRTLYSANFFDTRREALDLVEEMLHGNKDPDDLIFELQTLKENDAHG